MKKKTEKRSSPYHTYQVPDYLYKRLERKAMLRQKNTTQFCKWTVILREILDKKLSKKK